MSTQPIFAPDGTVRQIPQENLQDALSAGGKRAVQMTDPSGTLRYIPEDQVSTAMQAGGKVYQPAPNTLGDMADVALQGLKGIAQISAPGIAASLINKTAPGLAAKMQQIPYIGPAMQQAAPLKNIPGMATAAMAAPLAEGLEAGDLAPNPNPQPQPAPASPNAASPNAPTSLLKIMSRHIPIVGRGLRAMDTVQDLANLGKPPTVPTPSAPTQIPETNGIPWGSGGQGPLDLRGQRIPSTETQAAPQPEPQTPNAQPANVQPGRPAPLMQFDPVANSSQLAGHAYDPQTQTATIQFKNGQVHQYYGVTPEDWANYRNQSSPAALGPGKAFQAYIKRDPATGAGRTSRPLTATSAKSLAQTSGVPR